MKKYLIKFNNGDETVIELADARHEDFERALDNRSGWLSFIEDGKRAYVRLDNILFIKSL
jgi:hypothetical protein